LLQQSQYEVRFEKAVMKKEDFCRQPTLFDVHCFHS
jgi:hypothetical protein